MMFQINQKARDNFNQKSLATLMTMKELPTVAHRPSVVPLEAHIPRSIDTDDIIGDITQFSVGNNGHISERAFFHGEMRIGLSCADYLDFSALAENVQRLNGIRNQVSTKFVEDALFTWLKEAYQAGTPKLQFIEYLETQVNKAVQKIRVYAPLAFTSVELSFEFGGVTISNMSKALVDEHSPKFETIPDDERKYVEQSFEKFREEFQGYAAMTLEVVCEPNFAKQVCLERARAASDLLGLYSGATLVPDARCASRLKGGEFVEQSTVITVGKSNIFCLTERIVDPRSFKTWMISVNDIVRFRQNGFDDLSFLATGVNLSAFQESVLSMAFLYSKSAFTSEPVAKLVYVLSSLESILLKNPSESIQQNLSERLAIFSAVELDERKAIIRNVRTVYDLRSRYLHHGQSSSEIGEIREFLVTVWIFFVKIIGVHRSFKTKMEFLTSIDDEKLS